MKNLFILFFLLVGLSLWGQTVPEESKSLTFEQALNLSLQNNHLIKQYNHQSLQLEQEVKAAKGLYLPRITLSASYAFMSDNLSLDLTPVKDAITPLYSALGNYGVFSGVPNPDPNTNTAMPFLPDDYSTAAVRSSMLEGYETISNANWVKTIQEKQFGVVNAGFVMPLYTGGKINAANKAAQIKFEASGLETRQKSFELTGELVERYFGLVLANQALTVRQTVKEGMQKHYDDAQKLAQQGMIAEVEVLNVKVYFSDAERELKKAERQVDIVNEAVLNTVAEEGKPKLVPLSELFYLEKIEDLEYFKSKALQNSPLLGQVNKKRELAQQGVKVEQSAYLPTVAATGVYDIVDKDLSPYLPDYTVGVGLQWSLFDGNTRSRKVKAAKLQQMQADDYYKKAESDINSAITKYYQELHMYLEQIHELDASMDFTAEYSRAREKAFTEGMATATQVSDANLAVAKAKIERLQAIYAWDVTLSKLLYYAGMSDQFASYMNNPETKKDRY